MGDSRGSFERWAWRAAVSLLVLAALVTVILLIGLGTGGSGTS